MKQLFFTLMIATSLLSCKVTLIPNASAEIQAQKIEGAKMTEQLYLEMINSVDKTYPTYNEKYAAVEAQINSIMIQDAARPKSSELVKMDQILKDHFVKYRADHQTRTSLSNGEFQSYNEDLKGLWAPLLVSEKALPNN